MYVNTGFIVRCWWENITRNVQICEELSVFILCNAQKLVQLSLRRSSKTGLVGKATFGRMVVCVYLKSNSGISLCKKHFLACFQKRVVLSHAWKACPSKRSVFKLRSCVCSSPMTPQHQIVSAWTPAPLFKRDAEGVVTPYKSPSADGDPNITLSAWTNAVWTRLMPRLMFFWGSSLKIFTEII